MANEKRLIDANAKELIEQIDLNFGAVSRYSIKHILENAPTVDAVEVVRCNDCIHRHYVDMGEEIGAIGGCRLFGAAMSCNDFCSYGERRAEDG